MNVVWIGVSPPSVRRRSPTIGARPWTPGVVLALACAGLACTVVSGLGVVAASVLYGIYADRQRLPDIGPLTRFEFPTIGRIYDANDQPLIEFARESRLLTRFDEIPRVVRQAIVAAEDRRFYAHDGIDYRSLVRVASKVRIGAWVERLATGGRHDNTPGPAIFPQGGSTITQQLVRGVFLQRQTSQENSYQLRSAGVVSRSLSALVGARNANMARRKHEESRLALWLEREMLERFGSKARAKEEILARYASFVYMGHGQYGFASAAQHYLGRPLATLTPADADLAALLAGIMKSPRDYAPGAPSAPVLRRRNQILQRMAAEGFITRAQLKAAERRPLPEAVPAVAPSLQSSAVVEHVLDELAAGDGLGVDELLRGEVQVYATVDAGVQRIATETLEAGLARYERRHPGAVGVVQGAVVVLSNGDGSVLAEVGGRQVFAGRATSFRDFNRVRQARRQPGSAMKPIVYLAAFRRGFTLETLVPDEPISVADGEPGVRKWISNYDGRFKGPVPVRTALAESRNAVAVWITTRIGIAAVLGEARRLGVETPLQPYITTALGASEVTLLELASVYRAIASGVIATPHVIRRVVRATSRPRQPGGAPLTRSGIGGAELPIIQEGLRGVIRMPTGTAHALAGRAFPIAVMGKTGTTNDFRDAIFIGSTYGQDGITVAVRIGFDDNRSLGARETGGRVALPIFRDLMIQAYGSGLVGPVPRFPDHLEQRLSRALERERELALPAAPAVEALVPAVPSGTDARSRPPLQ